MSGRRTGRLFVLALVALAIPVTWPSALAHATVEYGSPPLELNARTLTTSTQEALNLESTPTTPVPQPRTKSSRLLVGISYGDVLPYLRTSERTSQLNDALDLRAQVVRADLSWADVQPRGPASYQWSGFDSVVAGARSRGLTVLAIVTYTPAWARPAGCHSEKCAPASAAAFARFARAAVLRYAPKGVHNWEIWNEPNITQFWQPAPSPARYLKLLAATSAAIRGADSSAYIVSGGLAPSRTADGSFSQLDYFKWFCDGGGLKLVDGVGYHPYSYPLLASNPVEWSAWSQIAASPTSLLSILRSHGQAGKAIWLTEYGAPTGGPGLGATLSDSRLGHNPDHVDELTQAAMVTSSFAAAAAIPNVRALIWYSDRDIGNSPVSRENFFGLRRFDGSRKPAYAAFRAATR